MAHLGTNYKKGLEYLESLGVTDVWTLERSPHPGVNGDTKGTLADKKVSIQTIKACFE